MPDTRISAGQIRLLTACILIALVQNTLGQVGPDFWASHWDLLSDQQHLENSCMNFCEDIAPRTPLQRCQPQIDVNEAGLKPIKQLSFGNLIFPCMKIYIWIGKRRNSYRTEGRLLPLQSNGADSTCETLEQGWPKLMPIKLIRFWRSACPNVLVNLHVYFVLRTYQISKINRTRDHLIHISRSVSLISPKLRQFMGKKMQTTFAFTAVA